jgi:hypothetical protein
MSSREPCATREVTLSIGLEGAPPPEMIAAVFVFDGGTLISHALLDGALAKVALPSIMSARVRILVGPAPRAGQPIPTLEALARLRPYEPAFNFKERVGRYAAPPVPDLYWRYWQWCRCQVLGMVIRNIGGVDRPLRGARVHVRKVEPFFAFLGGLSDVDVLRLRDDFVAAQAAPLPPAIAGLKSHSPALVRQALAENVMPLRSHWRGSPRWWSDRCTEIAAPVTDEKGRFDFEYWNLAEDDNDLDFRIRHPIGEAAAAPVGVTTPGLTVWDYVCGAEVTLRFEAGSRG